MRCQFTLLFLLFFSFISSSSSSNNNDLCFEYILQNECTPVLGEVSINQNEQQDFFDENVSLIVSNVRMFGSNCRRPFLSYYCQLMFGGFFCSSSSPEEQYCLEDQFCVQVSDFCSDDFSLNCSSSLSSPSPSPSPLLLSCEEKVTKEIEEVVETPIKVQTCLDNSKEEIECCIGPYVFDDNDECVVQCPQYIYDKNLERWIRLVVFTLFFVMVLLFLIAIIPFYMTDNLRYPKSIFFIFFAFYLLSFTPNTWMIFSGGFDFYICGDETNFWKAIDRYGNSTQTILQFSFWILFANCAACFWALFSFNLFCTSVRPFTTYFEKFIMEPVNPLISLFLLGFCLSFSVSVFLGCVLFAFLVNNDSKLFTPSSVYAFPIPVDSTFNVFQYTCLAFGLLGIAIFFLVIFFFLKRGRQIFYFQWRAVLAGCFWVIALVLYGLDIFLPEPSDSIIVDYTKCVASHPQITPTSCSREYESVDFNLLVDFLFVFLFLLLLVISFLTNDQMVGWWKDLIFRKCFSKYEQLEGENL